MARALARIAAFVRLGRPLYLVSGFVLYGLGAAMAARPGARLDWTVFGWGQIAITSTQFMAHYSNDYFDLEADRANPTPTRWSGGSRVLPNGELPPSAALVAALVLGVVALGAMAVLHFRMHAPPAGTTLLLLALLLAWEYSAPPLRLHSRGLGELTTAVVVAGLTPLAAYVLQTGQIAAAALAALAPIACLTFAALLAIEFPDAVGDAAVGKRTLVVRLGAPLAARLYLATVLAAYLLIPVIVAAGLATAVAVAAVAACPIAAVQAWRTARGAYRVPAQWETFTSLAIALAVLTATAELVAFIALTRAPG